MQTTRSYPLPHLDPEIGGERRQGDRGLDRYPANRPTRYLCLKASLSWWLLYHGACRSAETKPSLPRIHAVHVPEHGASNQTHRIPLCGRGCQQGNGHTDMESRTPQTEEGRVDLLAGPRTRARRGPAPEPGDPEIQTYIDCDREQAGMVRRSCVTSVALDGVALEPPKRARTTREEALASHQSRPDSLPVHGTCGRKYALSAAIEMRAPVAHGSFSPQGWLLHESSLAYRSDGCPCTGKVALSSTRTVQAPVQAALDMLPGRKESTATGFRSNV